MTCELVLRNLKIYWKTIFLIVYPLAILPIFLCNNTRAMRCLYIVALMAGFWVLEILPLPITALFPVALFPTMGIIGAKETSMAYFKETNMMFVGGLIIALAVEYCNLHTRISLHAIRTIGCSYRRLNFGLVTLTMLISMWISNTAATAMMIPIVQAVLTELDAQGLGRMWEAEEEPEEGKEIDPLARRPTRVSMCFHMSTAYAATIGGMGCLVGSGTNLVMKGIYETQFPDSPGVEFNRWMAANAPLMVAIMYPTWVWMQVWYMGLFRPNSKDAKAIDVGKEGEVVTRRILSEKLDEMGRLSAHEIAVGLLFILVALLWFLRRPGFMPGWPKLLTELNVGDSTAAMIVVVLLFVFPAQWDFLRMFHHDEERRPKQSSPPLLTWRFIHQKMHWSVIFLMGGGFALSEGIQKSGMGTLVADRLAEIANMPPRALLTVSCLMTICVTQFTSNAAVANILLPIVANLARKGRVHPMYLMMPIGMTCSFSYTLPVSTPPNAIAAAPCNMRTLEMVKVALMIELISYVMLMLIFPTLGSLIWDFSEYPEWAEEKNSTR